MKKQVDISEVKQNAVNPRIIKDAKFKKLVDSVKSFPDMLEKRPIVVDEFMTVLGGNMRLKACKEAGLKKVWIDVAEGWTDKQKKEFIIKDNVGFGEWDWHACPKPVKLYEWLLINYANKGDKILDTHLGSGSIAIACHNLGFDLTACEIDKEYYKKSIDRINNHKLQIKMF